MALMQRIGLGALVLVVVWNASWVVRTPAFPTLDGWTHLHTARMLLDGQTGGLYCPTPGLVPNQLGHWVLGGLQLMFPAMLAERLMLALIVLALGMGTLQVARAHGRSNGLLLLVLPFTYSHLLVLGFHNFLLGTGLALYGAAWWIQRQEVRTRQFVLLAALALLLFHAHTMALMVLCLLVCGHEVLALLDGRSSWRRAGAALLALLPALLLLAVFQLSQETSLGTVDRPAVLRALFDLRVVDIYHPAGEEKFNYALKVLLTATVATGLAWRLHAADASALRTWPAPRQNDLLLLLAGMLLGLSFILPDTTGYAGYITMRLHLLALLLLIGWLASLPLPAWVQWVPVVGILLMHNARLGHLAEEARATSYARDSLLEAAQHLPEGSVVLPYNVEDNWLLRNAASLLAVERRIHLLSNYEASNAYFPLQWCSGLPEAMRQELGGEPRCLDWLEDHVAQARWPVIDHIVVYGEALDTTRCGADALTTTLARHFEPGFTNRYARVFRRTAH